MHYAHTLPCTILMHYTHTLPCRHPWAGAVGQICAGGGRSLWRGGGALHSLGEPIVSPS
jgi:hypothetical protein